MNVYSLRKSPRVPPEAGQWQPKFQPNFQHVFQLASATSRSSRSAKPYLFRRAEEDGTGMLEMHVVGPPVDVVGPPEDVDGPQMCVWLDRLHHVTKFVPCMLLLLWPEMLLLLPAPLSISWLLLRLPLCECC